MAVKTIGNILSLKELKRFKINKAHIRKLSVTECSNLKKATDAHKEATGEVFSVCCCSTIKKSP